MTPRKPSTPTRRTKKPHWRISVMGDLALLFDDRGCHRASVYGISLARRIRKLLNAAETRK